MRFSLTTNATLLEPEDARLFRDHRFHVAVSLDGDRIVNDALRPMRDGGGSYRRIVRGSSCSSVTAGPAHLSARATVTPNTGALLPMLDHLIGLGFDHVGFAAALTSPDPALAFGEQDFAAFLQRMIACGRKALDAFVEHRPYPFSNFETALHEIHRGTHRPYPCGAGAGLPQRQRRGQAVRLPSPGRRRRLRHGRCRRRAADRDGRRAKHLRRATSIGWSRAAACWARYLCGGGCYHEVASAAAAPAATTSAVGSSSASAPMWSCRRSLPAARRFGGTSDPWRPSRSPWSEHTRTCASRSGRLADFYKSLKGKIDGSATKIFPRNLTAHAAYVVPEIRQQPAGIRRRQ